MGLDKNTFKALRYISLISQLALSLVTPCLLTVVICSWLKEKFGLGNWIMVAGILWGLFSGISSVWVYLKKAIKDAEKEQSEYESKFR